MGDKKVKGGIRVSDIDDDNIEEMNMDIRTDSDLDEGATEPSPEDLEDSLPEDSEDSEEQVSEPADDPEVERLKDLGLFREGIIENFNDLGKSYKHLEKKFSETRPAKPQREDTYIDPEQVRRELAVEFQRDPISVITRITNAMNYSTNSELKELRKELIAAKHDDYDDLKETIQEVERSYPDLDIEDALALARGRNIDKYTSKASEKERKREANRQLAQREKAGGVRTTAPSVEERLKQAREKAQSEAEFRKISEQILEQAGMGLKD